ncbi:MAG: RNA-binding protein [Pedosphaera sp.]|nr:RNA-binding protein [Pedosphaera sp.]
MDAPQTVRIDKWLWSARIFKTRSLATAACRAGHVVIASQPVKPSREVKINEIIIAKTGEITRTVKVLALLDKRVGAQVVKNFAEDLTPASEYQKKKESVLEPIFFRPKGSGRPTKKDRRDLEKFF